MVLLIPQFLPPLLLLPILSLLLLSLYPLSLALLLLIGLPLRAKIGEFLNPSLVQSIDDGVLSLLDVNFFDHLLIMERYLTRGH